ncbi:MAG: hypothetical protein H7338_07325 [Candidatus Sericytochromatia bacterium]|nr:hypothetical protein [Candidatus Sericytochromatia bacterium]
MTDGVTFDIRPTAGHAAATIAGQIGASFDMENRPARRTRYTAPLDMGHHPMRAPHAKTLMPDLAAMLDEIFDEAVLVPFDLDWQQPMVSAAVSAAVAANLTEQPEARRRVPRFERQRQELGDRLQAVRAGLKDVTLRVSMMSPASA